ncbi:MAG: MerR family transcriptional regulator [Coriobacteriales bacterium]|nr:MerR family transcriptional regulator [Coriobacteriales bacterium]
MTDECAEKNVPDQDYLTVGQLARKVGSTVRSIQYYDQQGLLAPSAKGPANQRLYSPEDEAALYRILTLKYLGLSLSDIKEKQDSINDSSSFREVLSATMETLEEDFQSLVKRLTVLRSLFKQAGEDPMTVDWMSCAHIIESAQSEGALFWHRLEDAPPVAEQNTDSAATRQRSMAVVRWHELIADTISLMNDGVAPFDERGRRLAERYLDLDAESSGSLEQMFEIAHGMSAHHAGGGAFEALRYRVVGYIQAAVAAYENGGDKDEAVPR